MKVSGIALVSFLATGAIAGGNGNSCKGNKVTYDPPTCRRITRDLADDLVEGLTERDEIEERGYGYPPDICNKKCPENKVTCSKFDIIKGGYKGSASATVDCKRSNDYTVTATIGPCKKGSKGPSKWYKRGNKGDDDSCLIVEYKCDKWPKDSQVSYIGVYDKKFNIPKKLKDLKDSGYCKGNTCIIPLNKLPGAADLCGDDLYIAYDAGRCKGNDNGPGYNSKGGKKYDDDHKGGKKYDDDHKGGKKYDDDHKGGNKYDDDRKGGNKYDDDHKGGKKYDDDKKDGKKYDDDKKDGKKYDDGKKDGKKYDDDKKDGKKYDNDNKGPKYDNDNKGPKYDNDNKGPKYDNGKKPLVDLKVNRLIARGGQDFKKDEIAFLKVRVQCEQKKVCKSYCCKI